MQAESANDRIIRDERDDEGVFDAPTTSAPRIDLVLGVGLALVAGVLGVLSSFGVGSVNAGPDLTTNEQPIASVSAPEPTPIAFHDDAQRPVWFIEGEPSEHVLVTDDLAFEVAIAPDAPSLDEAIFLEHRLAIEEATFDELAERALCITKPACDDEATTDRQRVVRMVAAAARMAAEDEEVNAMIDELRITVEQFVEHAAESESLQRTPAKTGPTALRVPTMRLPLPPRGL